jgi:hypothetical protein
VLAGDVAHEVGADEAGAAGDQNRFEECHVSSSVDAVVRVDAVFVGLVVIVRLGGDVDQVPRLGADPLHAVEYAVGNDQQHRVVLSHEDLVHLALRR